MNYRALTSHFLQLYMVLSGLTLQRWFPRAVLTLFSLFAFTILNAQPSDVAGTMPEDYLPELKQILQTALTRSPKVLEPLFEIEFRQAHLIRDNAQRLPSLVANFNYGITQVSESGSNSSSSRDQGLQYNVGLSQPIYHWGALKNATTIAKINVLLAEKSYAKAYRDLGILIRQSYLDLIVRKARLRYDREVLRLARENVKVLKERLSRGLVTPAEISGEELRIREVELLLERGEGEFLSARRTLARIAGVPELTEEAIPEELPRPVYSEALAASLSSALLRDGAADTLEATMYDLRIREAQLRYDIEKVRLRPKFHIGAGYSLENTTTVGTTVGQKAVARQTINIGGNWPIFDGFAMKAAKREAKSVERLQTARKKAELEALQETAQALERQLKLDATQLELAEIRRSMAVQARDRMKQEADLGNLQQNAVARADSSILAARATDFAARAAFLARWSEFVAVAGDDPVLNNLPVSHAREKK